MDLNILISCSGKQMPLVQSFVDALNGQGKVFAADINKYASSLPAADFSIVSPELTDENYGDWCLGVCEEHHIGLWISLLEDELLVLERLREPMRKSGCILVGAPTESIKNALDKYSHKSFLGQFGINVPETWTLYELKNKADIQEGNYIIKNRYGRGSRGLVRVNGADRLREIAQEKGYSDNWIAQEIIEGDVFCIDVINDLNSNFAASLIRKRLVMGRQETDVAETVINEDINRIAEKLALAIRHQGCMDVDIVQRGDELFVIDLNVRFGGSHIFSLAAGSNIPAALIAWRKETKPDSNWLKHRTGEIFTRYSTVTKYNPHNAKT